VRLVVRAVAALRVVQWPHLLWTGVGGVGIADTTRQPTDSSWCMRRQGGHWECGSRGRRLRAGRRANGQEVGAKARCGPRAAPNIPVELTAHSAGFLAIAGSVPVGRSSPGALYRQEESMNTDAITVHFVGPYELCSEEADVLADCPYSRQGGIYFWAVQMPDDQYRISYIGITKRSFYHRTKEHIINQLGGIYGIYDAEAMRRGELKVLWGGLWGKDRLDKLPEFIRQYETLAPHAKESLSVQKLFVAPLQYEARLMARIEGAMAAVIRESRDASSLLPEGIRYWRRGNAEAPVNVKFELPCVVQGLPTEMAV
jgi:hypothetical protein